MLTPPITERQFTALMKVCGIGGETGTHKAMRHIFVDGKEVREAAELAGITRNPVANAKNKVLDKYASISGRIYLLQEAFGDGNLLRDNP